MFPTGDKSKTARDTWANLIPNPYQPDRKWRALHAARGMQNLQIVFKVQLFWEDHKNVCNRPYGFEIYLENVKTMRTIAQIFVAFLRKAELYEQFPHRVSPWNSEISLYVVRFVCFTRQLHRNFCTRIMFYKQRL